MVLLSHHLCVPVCDDMVDADEIATLCYNAFKKLPSRGKPEPGREWTLLAAVLKLTRCATSGTGRTELCHNIIKQFILVRVVRSR